MRDDRPTGPEAPESGPETPGGGGPLPKTYDPASVEERIYRAWEEGGYFHVEPDAPGERSDTFTIVIPPPNVTDRLHLGHALNNTIQDILIRWRRMQGRKALWVPGTDHAGIATQAVVERRLFEEGKKTRHDIGRAGLVERIWAWRRRSGDIILDQLRKIGSSCDWRRTRFTLDEMLSRAVRQAFFRMFKDGLIFRGKRLVNWDTHLQTAVADDEVYHETVQGHLWHVRYPVKGEPGRFVTVATTRPETMLGDTAVAVHPKDERYKDLVGKTVILPLLGREIPVIADGLLVDPKFGSGCVKVTPAHDPNDYEAGRRNGLKMINILEPDGRINAAGGPYAGLDRFEARKRVVADLEEQGLLAAVEPYQTEVGHSDRSKTPIEPYLSDQWWVRMGDLADRTMEAVTSGRVCFHPERYARTYLDWLGQKRDWCISRQLWWGHRIPIWSCPTCSEADLGRAFAGRADVAWRPDEARGGYVVSALEDLAPDAVPGHTLVQDPDVLDTWFSSALWPLSTLGWPDETADLRTFYPTDVLVTAREIITLWVARMVMMGLYCRNEVPFKDVYIHAMIQDGEGRPMKKSLGNGVDPLEIVASHGADALRFTLAWMTTETQDVRMPVEINPETGRNTSPKFDMGRNFCNKLWNVARFVLMNLEGIQNNAFSEFWLCLEDKWILGCLEGTKRTVDEFLGRFQFQRALMSLYRFVWDDFCDWYVEAIKPRLAGVSKSQNARVVAQCVLVYVLDQTLRILHPFIPFVTEEIWKALNRALGNRGLWDFADAPPGKFLIDAVWPQQNKHMYKWYKYPDPVPISFQFVRSVVVAVRNIRNKFQVPPSTPLKILIKTNGPMPHDWQEVEWLIRNLGGVEALEAGPEVDKPPRSAAEVVGGAEVYVPLAGLIDLAAERKRLEERIAKERKFLAGIEKKLTNESFVAKAPPEVVERDRARADEVRKAVQALEANLADLK